MNQVELCEHCGQRFVSTQDEQCCLHPRRPPAPSKLLDCVLAAEQVIAYLTSEEGRAEMARINRENDEYFKRLKAALRPTWEQLHTPFDI